MRCIPHTVVPCLGVLGVSEHPAEEGRCQPVLACGCSPWLHAPLEGSRQRPRGDGQRGVVLPQCPSKLPRLRPLLSRSSLASQVGLSPPSGPHRPVTQFTPGLEFTFPAPSASVRSKCYLAHPLYLCAVPPQPCGGVQV